MFSPFYRLGTNGRFPFPCYLLPDTFETREHRSLVDTYVIEFLKYAHCSVARYLKTIQDRMLNFPPFWIIDCWR